MIYYFFISSPASLTALLVVDIEGGGEEIHCLPGREVPKGGMGGGNKLFPFNQGLLCLAGCSRFSLSLSLKRMGSSKKS